MTKQVSFSQSEYASKKKLTRREKFLRQMEELVPWKRLIGLIEPHYPKGKRGRPPIGLERMLRIYFLQQWYGLADEALEDALYDSQALRNFAGIDLAEGGAPDATTLLGFRHLLERHELTKEILKEVNAHLGEKQMLVREGTIVDATIIAAPPSTKNKSKQRDPEMHQTKKGNEWHFGMKAHVGTDTNGVVHSVVCTAANVADIACAHQLLHGEEQTVFADAGYIGVEKRPEASQKPVQWHVAQKRSQVAALPQGEIKELTKAVEKLKAQVRAKVEHVFHVVKNLFKHRKVRYRGLAKNAAQMNTLLALANLALANLVLANRRASSMTAA